MNDNQNIFEMEFEDGVKWPPGNRPYSVWYEHLTDAGGSRVAYFYTSKAAENCANRINKINHNYHARAIEHSDSKVLIKKIALIDVFFTCFFFTVSLFVGLLVSIWPIGFLPLIAPVFLAFMREKNKKLSKIMKKDHYNPGSMKYYINAYFFHKEYEYYPYYAFISFYNGYVSGVIAGYLLFHNITDKNDTTGLGYIMLIGLMIYLLSSFLFIVSSNVNVKSQ